MTTATHVIRRADLPENGVVHIEAGGGTRVIVVDIEGEVRAFAVSGPAAQDIDRAFVTDRRLRCATHGWPIDLDEGKCGAAELCRYRPIPVDIEAEEIRIRLD